MNNIDKTPSELLEAVQNAFSDSDEEKVEATESVQENAPEEAKSEPAKDPTEIETVAGADSPHVEEPAMVGSDKTNSGELHLSVADNPTLQGSETLDDLLRQEMAQQEVSVRRREKSNTEQEAAVPKEKVGFFRSLFKK